jgi:hypothetical protein
VPHAANSCHMHGAVCTCGSCLSAAAAARASTAHLAELWRVSMLAVLKRLDVTTVKAFQGMSDRVSSSSSSCTGNLPLTYVCLGTCRLCVCGGDVWLWVLGCVHCSRYVLFLWRCCFMQSGRAAYCCFCFVAVFSPAPAAGTDECVMSLL